MRYDVTCASWRARVCHLGLPSSTLGFVSDMDNDGLMKSYLRVQRWKFKDFHRQQNVRALFIQQCIWIYFYYLCVKPITSISKQFVNTMDLFTLIDVNLASPKRVTFEKTSFMKICNYSRTPHLRPPRERPPAFLRPHFM